MTDEELRLSILQEMEYGFISYGNLHNDDDQGMELIRKALKNMDKYRLHDLRKDPNDLPPCEREVDIVCRRVTYIGGEQRSYTFGARAIYEDGTMHSEDSNYLCGGFDDWCEYCEETDDYIIPEGWIECAHFGEIMGLVDAPVIAWRESALFEEDT